MPQADVERFGLELAPVYRGLVVVECRYDYARAAFVYMALGPQFDEVASGTEAPEYLVTIHTRAGRIEGASFRRLD